MSHNLQSLFDLGCKGVIAQGLPSISHEDQMCLYRGPNGTKCALGHCIPDLHYDANMEGATVRAIGDKLGWDADSTALFDFQRCHDDAAADDGDFIANFKASARDFATRHNLDTKVLDHVDA